MYAQLDVTIGALLDRLDTLVGPDKYVVALSADHGVTPIPEQLKAEGKDGGRLDSQAIFQAIEGAAQKRSAPGDMSATSPATMCTSCPVCFKS